MSEAIERLQTELQDAASVEEREQITGISLDNLRVTVKALATCNVLLSVGAAALAVAMAAGLLPVAPDASSWSNLWSLLGVMGAAALVGGLGGVIGGAIVGRVSRDRRGHVRMFIGSSVFPWVSRFVFFWIIGQVFAVHISLLALAAMVLVTSERLLVQANEAYLAKALQSGDEPASVMLAEVTNYRRTMGITGNASSSGTGTVRLVWCLLWWTLSGLSLAALAQLAPLVGAGVVVLALALEWGDFHRPNADQVFTRNLAIVAIVAMVAVLVVAIVG